MGCGRVRGTLSAAGWPVNTCCHNFNLVPAMLSGDQV